MPRDDKVDNSTGCMVVDLDAHNAGPFEDLGKYIDD